MMQDIVGDIDSVENRTHDEIAIGDSAVLTRTLRPEDIRVFATMAGEVNPAHIDPEYARSAQFREIAGHGMWGSAMIANLLGTQFPGPGTVLVSQHLRFAGEVRIGDTITATVVCRRKLDDGQRLVFACVGVNRDGPRITAGRVEVAAPAVKTRRPRAALPPLAPDATRGSRYQPLLSITRGLPPIAMAMVHPCDTESLRGALMARDAGLALPTLVGPEARIRALAEQLTLDLAGCRLLDVPHSHAAAGAAVALAREGEVAALMKGSLHTDELMAEVVDKATGLRTARRISHVFLMDVPTYPRPLLITDAAVNVQPALEDKVDIVQNAIDLARVLRIAEPKVAILAAVETVTPKMPAVLDAAALCKMAERGQITGGILDGPLAFDNAVSAVAAATKGIRSAVAGQADILLVPDIESGNMLAKQLEYLAGALAAGIVLGARVPIVLTSRADPAEARVASAAIAAAMVHARGGQA